MNDCERFEKLYLDWKKGGLNNEEAELLTRHASVCGSCTSINEADMRLRGLLKNQAVYRPTNGFELRLERSIRAVENNQKPVRLKKSAPLFPRWTALGAGLATGLAVGILVLSVPVDEAGKNSPISSISTPANQLIADVSPQSINPVEDTLASKKDTSSKVDSHYLVGDYGKVVSGR